MMFIAQCLEVHCVPLTDNCGLLQPGSSSHISGYCLYQLEPQPTHQSNCRELGTRWDHYNKVQQVKEMWAVPRSDRLDTHQQFIPVWAHGPRKLSSVNCGSLSKMFAAHFCFLLQINLTKQGVGFQPDDRLTPRVTGRVGSSVVMSLSPELRY